MDHLLEEPQVSIDIRLIFIVLEFANMDELLLVQDGLPEFRGQYG